MPAAVLDTHPILRGGGKDRADLRIVEIPQRRLAAPRFGQGQARRHRPVLELAEIQLYLGHLLLRGVTRESLVRALSQVKVQHDGIKGRIGPMAVPLPIFRVHVQLDGAAQHGRARPIRKAHRGVGEVRAGFMVPDAVLDDFHALAVGGGQETGTEVSREPVGLELEFVFLFGCLFRGCFAQRAIRRGEQRGVAMGKLHGFGT